MKEQSRLWMRACIEKTKDRLAAVPCPVCSKGTVEIEDIFVGEKPVESRLYCSACNAQSFARLSPQGMPKDTPLAQLPTRPTRH